MNRILIKHVTAVTLDDADRVLHDTNIAIERGTILSVGDAPAAEQFAPDEVIDGADMVALPGLFNAHCHAPMTLVRGWAEDLPFSRWLNERIWVAESALEPDDVYWGAALAACEMLRAGVVGFADHYFWMEQVAQVVEQSGMKALLAWCVFGRDPEQEVGGATLETTAEFARSFQGAAGGRIRTAMGPHSPYMCPPEVLRRAAAAARALDVPVHLHLSESAEQVQNSLQRFGKRPVAHVAAQGVLDGPAIAAHCIELDDADVELLAQHSTTVAHTPKTYMKLAMGMTPVQRLLDAGVPVALGTDGPASNSDLNLLEVARLAGQVQKWQQRRADALPVSRILRMACADGAWAMGFARSGTLAPGAAADLVLMSTRGPHWWPRHDLPATVVYGAHPADVRHVLVDGRVLLRRGRLTTLDEERIRHEAQRRGLRITGQDGARLRKYDA